MKRQKGEIFIRTSGWVYGHWEGVFYPEDLSPRDKLKYFSQHLPRSTPADFLFTLNAKQLLKFLL